MTLLQPSRDQIPELFARVLFTEDPTEIAKSTARHLEELKNPNHLFFIDDDGSAYAQLITANAENDPDLADGKTTAHIHDLLVDKRRRRKHKATALLKELEAHAKQNGFTTLTVGVDSWNQPARALYKKLGYTLLKAKEGRLPEEKRLYLSKALYPK